MNRYTSHTLRCLWVLLLLLLYRPASVYSQNYYPVHVNVQVLPPYGVYLTDYYSANRDRLIVTLLNRDKQQRPLQVKLRVRIKNSSSFRLSSRDELYYPMITLESGVPLRLTGMDLSAYLTEEKIRMEGRLNEGKLPTGMTEFSVQAVDYATGRVLSDWATGRAWLEMKQPPTLNIPLKNEQVAYRNPQQIRFQWMPRHQGLAGTEYEFVLKELPDNGSEPQSAYAYGQEIYRTRTRFTTLNYTQLEPSLIPGKMYGWQIRAIAKDGADEIGMFENNGFSEVGWFELNDNCPAPTQVTAKGGYRKMTLNWNSLPEQRSFVVEYRPKSEHSLYEWTSVRTFDTSLTVYELTPGWKYEYRVGALCMTDKPVYSPLGEITLSVDNEERLAQCGVWPDVDFSNKNGKENLTVGEVVIIGRDFPMTVTQISSQGNGWYSGKGRLTLPWIFDMPVAVQFSRLRINTDNRQIDGEVETETDPNASNIGNTNELDYGGKPTNAAKLIIVTKELDFTVPAVPEATFDPESGELIIFDTDGEPHVIATQKNEGKSIFPMIVEDADGNKYQIDAPPADESGAPGADGGNDTSSGGVQKPVITPIKDASSGFNKKSLSDKFEDVITFSKGDGKYAFDAGREPWYETAQLIKQYYHSLGKNYIAPWKLIPVGESDVVEAELFSTILDKRKVLFVLGDGTALPAREVNGKWELTLPSVGSGETYEVFALYEDKKNKYETLGKLNVVSYPSQHQTVTLVPVNGAMPDVSWTERELNRIYNPYGIQITVKTDPVLDGNTSWDLDGDGVLNLNGSGFFTKETKEMRELRKLYEKTAINYDRHAYYIFVLNRASAGDEPDKSLVVQGDMPRGKQFGYIFMDNTSNTPRLIAHELGHGIFTLRHSFDVNYSGDKFKATTGNLMDYNNGEDLAVWQWNILAHPAPLTWFDSDDDDKLVSSVALVGGHNTGIAPNGKVIREFHSLSGYQVAHIISKDSYYIHGFKVYDKNRNVIRTYQWNSEKNDYYDGSTCISESKDVMLTYNVAEESVQTVIYASLGDHCFYQYAKVLHVSGSKHIDKPAPSAWKTEILFNASASCRDNFIKDYINQVLANDRNDCSAEDVAAGVTSLKALIDSNDSQQLVNGINNVCLSAIKNLSYDEIKGLFIKVASQEKLKEESELAILRLMNAFSSNDYSRFYSLLEDNGNALITHLVDQMDDVSPYFWIDGNNYTNFIGALITMFKNKPESYLDRVGNIGDDKLLGQVFNLHSQPFKSDLDISFSNWTLTSLNEFRFSGVYHEKNGTVDVVQEEKIFINTGMPGDNNEPEWLRTATVSQGLSPLTPIIISTENELPLVATALDAYGNSDDRICVVPAIFLKYKGDKELNDAMLRATMNTLDVVTIAVSAPTALATKVTWVKRIWAMAEVAGAISDIAINESIITDPNLKAAADSYNVAMGLIGIKNIGKGIVRYSSGLPNDTKKALVGNASLQNLFSENYKNWQAAIGRIKSLAIEERWIIEKQLWNWRLCKRLLQDNAFVYNPNMSPRVRQILANSEAGMGKFVNINYWASRGVASAEEIEWMQNFVTKNFPIPQEGEIMRKVIDIDTMEKWQLGKNNSDFVTPGLRENGFVTKADDYVLPLNAEDIIENLRLDYAGTSFAKNKGFAVIEFKCKSDFDIEHPFNTDQRFIDPPYTNTGMTGSKFNVIPEYVHQQKVVFSDGDVMKVYDKNGKLIKTYKLEDASWEVK